MPQELSLNGIDAATGGPIDDFPVTTEILAKVARGQRITPEDLKDARIKNSLAETDHFGVAEGIEISDLSQTGWGVIFPAALPPKSVAAIQDALKPLLDLRKKQAGDFYFEFVGAEKG